MCDVALDPYTSHGHDGILKSNYVLNDETIYRKHLTQSVYATANIASVKFQNVNKGLKHLLQSIAFMIIFFVSLYTF